MSFGLLSATVLKCPFSQNTITTNRNNVFHFTEGKCPQVNSVCEGNPCPEGTECLGDPKEGKYTCVCQDSKAGQCPGKKLTLKIST